MSKWSGGGGSCGCGGRGTIQFRRHCGVFLSSGRIATSATFMACGKGGAWTPQGGISVDSALGGVR